MNKAALMLGSATFLWPAMAHADTPAQQARQAPADIVVTSRMRSERLRDIPESITAFSAQQIERAGIQNVKDFVSLTPNITMLPSFRQGVFNLTSRGDSTPQGGDSPIVVNFDGVQAPALDIINQDLFDIERIEVLKGPQGALYGQGASAGAINIYTRRPGNMFEGFAKASYGNGNTRRLAAGLSGPLVKDHIFLRVAGYTKQSDGLIDNVTLGTKADFLKDFGARGRLIATYGAFTADLRASYSKTISGLAYETVIPADANGHFDLDGSSYRIASNLPSREQIRLFTTSLKLDYDLPGGTLTSVTGYSQSRQAGFGDLDFTPAQILTQDVGFRVNAVNSELRFTSKAVGPLHYVVGAFYQSRRFLNIVQIPTYLDDGGPVPTNLADPRLRGPLALDSRDITKSRSWALFANATYALAHHLELTLAARYDNDRRTAESLTAGPVSTLSRTFARLQPKVSLGYHPDDHILVYATFGQGFRSGSFNAYLANAERLIKAEVTDNYEAGTKVALLDNRLTFDASVYHVDFRNRPFYYYLANGNDSSQNIVTIDTATSDGVELEVSARPTDALSVQASYGVVIGRVGRFQGGTAFTGNQLPDTPTYTANLSTDYTVPLGDSLKAVLRVAVRRQGQIYYDLANAVSVAPKTFVDLKATLMRGPWSLAGFVSNLGNERFSTNYTPTASGVAYAQPNQPRSYGVELSTKF